MGFQWIEHPIEIDLLPSFYYFEYHQLSPLRQFHRHECRRRDQCRQRSQPRQSLPRHALRRSLYCLDRAVGSAFLEAFHYRVDADRWTARLECTLHPPDLRQFD